MAGDHVDITEVIRVIRLEKLGRLDQEVHNSLIQKNQDAISIWVSTVSS